MLKNAIKLLPASTFLFPVFANAVTYTQDGAVMLGASEDVKADNLVAAIGGANLSLTCLVLMVLMLVSIYIFHLLWHPIRVHEDMTLEEKQRGTLKFYIGGTLLWMVVSVMAESWCTILPLAIILAGALMLYIYVIISHQPPVEDN